MTKGTCIFISRAGQSTRSTRTRRVSTRTGTRTRRVSTRTGTRGSVLEILDKYSFC